MILAHGYDCEKLQCGNEIFYHRSLAAFANLPDQDKQEPGKATPKSLTLMEADQSLEES
jgi:hypothetical protein